LRDESERRDLESGLVELAAAINCNYANAQFEIRSIPLHADDGDILCLELAIVPGVLKPQEYFVLADQMRDAAVAWLNAG
jgi:hypothetical protein